MMISILFEIFIIMVCAYAAGLLGGLLGLGGAVILTPLLTIFIGLPIQYAAGISLSSAVGTSITSGYRYLKLKIPDLRVFLFMASAGTTGAIMGSLLLYELMKTKYNWILYIFFSIIMYIAAFFTAKQAPKREMEPLSGISNKSKGLFIRGKFFDPSLHLYVDYFVDKKRLFESWGVMLFGGLMSGLLGIGGGPINMFALYGIQSLPIKVASATSNLIVGVTASTSGSIYWQFGYIHPFLSAVSIIGIIAGALHASSLLPKTKGSTIKIVLLSVFSYLAFRMLLSGLRRGNIIIISQDIEYMLSFIVLILTAIIMFLLRDRISE